MLTRPIMQDIKPYDAAEDKEISFSVYGGDQVVKNEIQVEVAETNTEVFSNTKTTFQKRNEIPANTLENGTEYRIRVRTFNSSDESSDWSDWVVFKCLTNPVLEVTNIPSSGIVNNNSFTFEGSYSQQEGEMLQSYVFILYDENQNELERTSEIFSFEDIQYEFSGFENNVAYYVQFIGFTENGMEPESDLYGFTASYIQPELATVTNLENNYDQASIEVTAFVVQIIGELRDGSMEYIDGEKIDLSQGRVRFDEGFSLNSDFSLNLWLESIEETTNPNNPKYFLTISGLEGKLQMYYYDNRIWARKVTYGMSNFFRNYISNSFDLSDNQLWVCLQHINHRVGLEAEVIS